MNNNLKNTQGGFIGTIIIIVIVLLIMNYYGITLTGIWNWLWALITSVF
jgi:hypothetical protein